MPRTKKTPRKPPSEAGSSIKAACQLVKKAESSKAKKKVNSRLLKKLQPAVLTNPGIFATDRIETKTRVRY